MSYFSFPFFARQTCSPHGFDHHIHVCKCDIGFHQHYVSLRVRHSKTNQYGQRVFNIPLSHIPNSKFSPVTFLALMYKLTPKGCGPLFRYHHKGSWVTLTYPSFVHRLKSFWLQPGWTHLPMRPTVSDVVGHHLPFPVQFHLI